MLPLSTRTPPDPHTAHYSNYTFWPSLCIQTCPGGLQRQSVPALPCCKHNRDEMHIMCHCPTTKLFLAQFTDKFQGLTRLLDLPSFTSFTQDEIPLHQSSLKTSKAGLQKPPPSVASLHTPFVCTSHPFTLLLWNCPLMMMLPCHLIAMMIFHLSYFHPVSSQRPHHHMARMVDVAFITL